MAGSSETEEPEEGGGLMFVVRSLSAGTCCVFASLFLDCDLDRRVAMASLTVLTPWRKFPTLSRELPTLRRRSMPEGSSPDAMPSDVELDFGTLTDCARRCAPVVFLLDEPGRGGGER